MKKSQWVLALGIFFVACNLRVPIISVGALTSVIQKDIGISSGIMGFITTIPLLAFAGVSLLIPKLEKRFGMAQVMLGGLLLLGVGELIRSYGGVSGLFLGTLLLGCGIAAGNVLIPAIIKKQFPSKLGLMTGMYTTAMPAMAGIGAGISVPLTQLGMRWQQVLLLWLLLTLVAIVVWLPQLRNPHLQVPVATKRGQESKSRSVFQSPLAWKVTLYMGTQSLLFYSLVAWLPSIIQSNGFSVEMAGNMAFFFQLIGIPVSFLVPLIIDRSRDQRYLTTICASTYLLSMVVLLLGGKQLPFMFLGVALCGICASASMSMIMCFLGLRAMDAQQAAELSAMAQSIGYLVAAVGPTLVGYLFDQTGRWTMPLLIFMLASLLLAYFGRSAGKNQHLFENE